MNKLIWYLNRLRRMSLPEVFYRVKQVLYNKLQKNKLFRIDNVPNPVLDSREYKLLLDNLVEYKNEYIETADKIISGQYKIFDIEVNYPHAVPEWNTDPKSGVVAPISYGKSIDYRDNAVVGDIKYLWEPNRHLHLVVLAQAYCLTGNAIYLDTIKKHLESWFENCPYLQGPNWSSSLELGIRLINWSLVWRLIGGANSFVFAGQDGKDFKHKWLSSVYQHTHFINHNLSRFSSANNHLIGELSSIVVATCTWPYWDDMRQWREQGCAELSKQALIQNYSDGVNREQAISYQQFVCDFLLFAGLASNEYEFNFTDEYWLRIESMLQYISSIMDVAGNMPMIGDADDGYVNILSLENDFCPYKSLLAVGAEMFKNNDFALQAKGYGAKYEWLRCIYPNLKSFEIKQKHQKKLGNSFVDGGYYILQDNFNSKDAIKLIVDCGPLGFLSIAAHGHADALAVYLSVKGREFFIDVGTYSYHAEPFWRDYFKSTAAHNTVVIDGESQSVSHGNFMWSHHASSNCKKFLSTEKHDEFVGMHDGYGRLYDPVMHKRGMYLDKVNKHILIQDTIICESQHTVELYWHFSEYCVVEIVDKEVIATNDGVVIKLDYSNDSDIDILQYQGSESPPCGWVSRSFGVKIPTTSIVIKKKINTTTIIKTRISY